MGLLSLFRRWPVRRKKWDDIASDLAKQMRESCDEWHDSSWRALMRMRPARIPKRSSLRGEGATAVKACALLHAEALIANRGYIAKDDLQDFMEMLCKRVAPRAPAECADKLASYRCWHEAYEIPESPERLSVAAFYEKRADETDATRSLGAFRPFVQDLAEHFFKSEPDEMCLSVLAWLVPVSIRMVWANVALAFRDNRTLNRVRLELFLMAAASETPVA